MCIPVYYTSIHTGTMYLVHTQILFVCVCTSPTLYFCVYLCVLISLFFNFLLLFFILFFLFLIYLLLCILNLIITFGMTLDCPRKIVIFVVSILSTLTIIQTTKFCSKTLFVFLLFIFVQTTAQPGPLNQTFHENVGHSFESKLTPSNRLNKNGECM